jgi:hypothetical protein
MPLNLSGAHGPAFTRSLADPDRQRAGRTGVGEVTGDEKIRPTLEDAAPRPPAPNQVQSALKARTRLVLAQTRNAVALATEPAC